MDPERFRDVDEYRLMYIALFILSIVIAFLAGGAMR